jgi:hypothetical protein
VSADAWWAATTDKNRKIRASEKIFLLEVIFNTPFPGGELALRCIGRLLALPIDILAKGMSGCNSIRTKKTAFTAALVDGGKRVS